MNLRTLIVFAGLTLISPCVADLATALQPLYKPDIASARIAVKNIEQFAKTATSGGKEAADLGKSIKGLYSAEFKLLKAIENQNKQENEALKQDKSSRDWMDGTSMNPGGHPRHARSAIVKAAKIRQDAAMIVAKADDALVTAMTRIDEHIKVLFEAEDLESTYILCSSIKAMNDRFFQKSPFKLSVSADVLKKFEIFIAKRPLLLSDAKVAEKAGAFGKAFRLFSEAKNEDGRRRNAALLAANLEGKKLYGEAAEYYEAAGDFEDAKRIRDAHPDLLTDSFRKLGSKELFEKIAPATVLIRNTASKESSIGTGFFFKKGGYILTNNHVIEGYKSLEIVTSDQKKHSGKVIARTVSPDLAVVKIDLLNHEVVRLGTNQAVKTGAEVALVGFPQFNDSSSATITTGVISNVARKFESQIYFQTDAATSGGNSGGPLCLSNGQVVGVLTIRSKSSELQNINFAIRIDDVRKFLSRKLGKDFADSHIVLQEPQGKDSKEIVPRLKVVKAMFGGGRKFADVTERVRDFVEKQKADFYVTSKSLKKDPTPGWKKELRLTIEIDGKVTTKKFNEGSRVQLEKLTQ
ncbi:S1C family serine protease [Akkermansiaceae bacterium]|nr:S1C family serine protease [Akkermansiaceae bacterium]